MPDAVRTHKAKRDHRHADGLSHAVHFFYLARERLRHAVSSGEEPDHWVAITEELRGVVVLILIFLLLLICSWN